MRPDHTVVVFGELLLRLDTPGFQRLVQAQSLNLSFTGGEANVAVAISQWGGNSAIVSAVPSHDVGTACINHFRRYGVKTDAILRQGDRLGILYVETGAGQRGSQVTYDRHATSFRQLHEGDIDWKHVLEGASCLHLTGTAVVSPSTKGLIIAGLKVAQELSLEVSFDVSYRSQLWGIDVARQAFLDVLPYVTFFIGSEQDASTFFGIHETGDAALRALARNFHFKWVAWSQRVIDAQGQNDYSAKLYDGESIFESPTYQTTAVDRIGTGDAFAAGLIHSLQQNRSPQEMLNFATAAAVFKHTIPGDFALFSVDDVESLMRGQNSGKIRR